MRILEVSEFYSPSKGGSAQVVYQTARHLAQRGHDVTVVASNYGLDKSRFPNAEFETVLLPSVFNGWNFYVTLALIPWARKHLPTYDIIHLHNVRTFQNIVIAAMCRRLNIPYVMSAHGSLPLLVSRKAAKCVFDILFGNRLVRGAHAMIAVSAVEVDQYLAAGIEEAKITLVSNGLDLSEFSNLPPRGRFRQHLGLPSDATLVLFLGRLHPIKGVDHLLSAFAQVQSELKNAHLAIAGPDDGDLTRLKAIARDVGLVGNVHFPGGLYGTDKLAALVDADVVAGPSQYEIFGLVLFEALLCGTPVVATAGSASGQLLQQASAGYLAPYGDATALAHALLSAHTNPIESQQMVQAGQAFVRSHLQWSNIAEKLEQVYAAVRSPRTTYAQRLLPSRQSLLRKMDNE